MLKVEDINNMPFPVSFFPYGFIVHRHYFIHYPALIASMFTKNMPN